MFCRIFHISSSRNHLSAYFVNTVIVILVQINIEFFRFWRLILIKSLAYAMFKCSESESLKFCWVYYLPVFNILININV